MDRKRALKAKRGKVRDLLAQAILAQVRKLAKEEKFDFMSETDAQKLNLFVKLSDDHAVVLHIPFKDFKQFLPQLRSVIVTLTRAVPERHPLPDRRPGRVALAEDVGHA